MKSINERLVDKLESKSQVIESLEKDLKDARSKLSKRRASVENGTPQPDGIDVKYAKVKDAIMKEPDMEPKQPSDLGKQYHSYIHAVILWAAIFLYTEIIFS